MAAFQVFLYGRFWVFTEVYSSAADNVTKSPTEQVHSHQGVEVPTWTKGSSQTGAGKTP